MTGAELKDIRVVRLRMDLTEFALVLGYRGSHHNTMTLLQRYEVGSRPIPPLVARVALLLALGGVPTPWLDMQPEGVWKDVRRDEPELWAMLEREFNDQMALREVE